VASHGPTSNHIDLVSNHYDGNAQLSLGVVARPSDKRLDAARQAWYGCWFMSPNPPSSVYCASDEMRGLVESASTLWVEFLVTLLENEGRPIQGGWPGTVSEARRRLVTCLAEQAEELPQDTSEMTILVDILYSKAKQLWLRECY
jgi:hypothetical protein